MACRERVFENTVSQKSGNPRSQEEVGGKEGAQYNARSRSESGDQ